MDVGTIAVIASAALAVLGSITVIVKYAKALKESVDVLTAVTVALSDGKLTPEEIGDIKAEFDEAKEAWK